MTLWLALFSRMAGENLGDLQTQREETLRRFISAWWNPWELTPPEAQPLPSQPSTALVTQHQRSQILCPLFI